MCIVLFFRFEAFFKYLILRSNRERPLRGKTVVERVFPDDVIKSTPDLLYTLVAMLRIRPILRKFSY